MTSSEVGNRALRKEFYAISVVRFIVYPSRSVPVGTLESRFPLLGTEIFSRALDTYDI